MTTRVGTMEIVRQDKSKQCIIIAEDHPEAKIIARCYVTLELSLEPFVDEAFESGPMTLKFFDCFNTNFLMFISCDLEK